MKDDLISRKTLIEAFKEEFFCMYSDDFNYMIKWFEGLPTAEITLENGHFNSKWFLQLWEKNGENMSNLIFFGMCACTITAAVVSIILDRVFRHE